jgi:hypothetical protein
VTITRPNTLPRTLNAQVGDITAAVAALRERIARAAPTGWQTSASIAPLLEAIDLTCGQIEKAIGEDDIYMSDREAAELAAISEADRRAYERNPSYVVDGGTYAELLTAAVR